MKKLLSILTISLLISCKPVDPPIVENESTTESTENEISSESGKNPTTTNSLESTTSFGTSNIQNETDLTTGTISTSSSSFETSEILSEVSSENLSESSSSSFESDTSSVIECGNSIIEESEECDDGNNTDDDDCSNECYSPRIIFLTNDYIGLANFGGIDVADDICQFEAELFNLPGIFKAWLSDDDELNDPYYRFNSLDFKGWYKLLPYNNIQSRIVKGWDGLNNNLETPINITSAGNKDLSQPPMVKVFNATGPDGKRNQTGTTCNSWTVWDINMSTYVGSPQEIASEWYAYGLTSCGSETGGKLYCFQVE